MFFYVILFLMLSQQTSRCWMTIERPVRTGVLLLFLGVLATLKYVVTTNRLISFSAKVHQQCELLISQTD